jgi:3-hydroxyacyl-CoA dehydrogenase
LKTRNSIAESAIAKLASRTAAFMRDKNNARLVIPGNIEDHLEWLKEVDWVIEAVIEDRSIKRRFAQKLDNICRPDT